MYDSNINNTEFIEDFAGFYGGALYLEYLLGKLCMFDCQFIKNIAIDSGHSIYNGIGSGTKNRILIPI